jgi:hypothetical protein
MRYGNQTGMPRACGESARGRQRWKESKGSSRLSWPLAREVCLVSPDYPATERRVPRGPPQSEIASRVDRQQAADIRFRVSSSNTLFRSGTVSPVRHSGLGGAGSRLSPRCPRWEGCGFQRRGKPIGEVALAQTERRPSCVATFRPVANQLAAGCPPVNGPSFWPIPNAPSGHWPRFGSTVA